MSPHLQLERCARGLTAALGAGYLVCFDAGSHVRAGSVWHSCTLSIYLDVQPLTMGTKLAYFFESGSWTNDDGPAVLAARVVARAEEWLMIGRSLGTEAA